MLDQIAGITRVRMLYLQLLYKCNFSCKHCFHGELLSTSPRSPSIVSRPLSSPFSSGSGNSSSHTASQRGFPDDSG
ncbi:hypothetical protein [Rhizomonospora bruguierae]|uniref:hypothetical protein n=1 Tax=Rhizomonospora bruguierae TaxID=1581705 RepID=UPI001BD0DDF9|nr:hypothetical protein [Micromonospora sp. NBRC 107566]